MIPKQPKDFWDKLGTVTPYVGGLFGLLGQGGQRKHQQKMADYYANLTREMQEKTFGNNKALMEMQQKFDRGMFDYSNAYNTPLNQMKRLKEAGLNPALMYGQGTTGNTNASMPTADIVPTTFSGAEIAQSAASGAQMSVMNSQVQLNKANAISRGIDSVVKAKQYGLAETLAQYQMDNLSADTSTKLQQALNISEDTQLKMKQRGLTEEKINSEKIMQKLNNANVDLIKVKTDLEKINKGQAEKGIFPSMIQTFMNAYNLDFRKPNDRVLAQGVITSLLASQIIRSFR
jgi:hypothetical protein